MYMTERQLKKILNATDEWERHEREVEMIQFYALAQKYGFCTPFCECSLCSKEE